MIRSYVVRGSLSISQDITNASLDSQEGSSLVQTLILQGELKTHFLSLVGSQAKNIFITASQDGTSLSVCFTPESKSYKNSPQTIHTSGDSIGHECTSATCIYCAGNNTNPIALQNQQDLGTTPTDTAPPTSSPTPTTLVHSPSPTLSPAPSVDIPVIKKVMVIDFNPLLENQGNVRIRTYKNWNNPIQLENQFIQDIQTASGGYFNYQIAVRLADVDTYPMKNTGYVFTDSSYLSALSSQDTNARAIINYNKVLTDYDVCGKVNRGEIDELWLWGGPWFGYWEAVMAGPGAYWTNASPILNTTCTRKLHILGFSYERGISEMLEDFGHRTEGTMRTAYSGWFSGGNTDWDKFTKSRAFHPNDGTFSYGCGSIHEPFNASGGYDWSNSSAIANTCSAWTSYPPAPITLQTQTCSIWGCTGYGYLKMWLKNLPKAVGQTNGKWNNWWKYIGDIN